MKVKLLKKVRKRYSIVRVDKIGTNPGWLYRHCEKEIGIPFYILRDDQDGLGFRTVATKEFDNVKEKLCKWIKEDYTHKVRKKKTVEVKVWHNSK